MAKPKCPFCGNVMEPTGSIFIEGGDWDGKSYEVEGDRDLYTCPKDKTQIALVEQPQEGK